MRTTYVVFINDQGRSAQVREQWGGKYGEDPRLSWPYGKEVLTATKVYVRPHALANFRDAHPDADIWVKVVTRGQGNNIKWTHREASTFTAEEKAGADPAVVRVFEQPYERVYSDAQVRARFEIL